jgi:hypothetical protein
LKAIETRYRGYRFRSRLEARWAVYFDAIGLTWEYEAQGFDLDGVCYLPDFWLPNVDMFAEVKPEAFNKDELRKTALLAWKSGCRVLLLDGTPSLRTYDYLECVPCNTWGEIGLELGIRVGEDEAMIQKIDCVISMYHGYPIHERRFYASTGGIEPQDFSEQGMFDDVPLAVAAARGARFEHGETPR